MNLGRTQTFWCNPILGIMKRTVHVTGCLSLKLNVDVMFITVIVTHQQQTAFLICMQGCIIIKEGEDKALWEKLRFCLNVQKAWSHKMC